MEKQIICDNPRIVFNPAAPALLLKHRVFYMHGIRKVWRGNSLHLLNRSFGRVFNVKHNGINKSNFENCFILSDDGETFPLYIAVPCGKCPNCELSRQYSFVQRCRLESQLYDNKPWFVTLTYGNSFLPKDGVLSVRDTQLFLKRFRQLLARRFDGVYNYPIRYAICGEYGKKGRPHYHLIVWNLHSYNSNDFKNIKSLINDAWGLGFITARIVNVIDGNKTFKYTTKYLCKDNSSVHLPFDGAPRPFLNSSRTKGRGGLGKPYLIDNIAEMMSSRMDTHPLFYDKWSSSIVELSVNSWVLDTVFPSWSRMFPSSVRRALVELSYWCPDHYLLSLFRRYTFIPDHADIVSCFSVDTSSFSFDSRESCELEVSKWLRKVQLDYGDLVDFFDKLEVHNKRRDCFLYALFTGSPVPDVAARSYLATRMSNRSKSLEQL